MPAFGDSGDRVQVRFITLPEGFSHGASFPTNVPCVYMYAQLERDLRVERQSISIKYEGRPLKDTDVLNEVVALPGEGEGDLVLHLSFDIMPKHLSVLGVGENVLGTLGVQVNYGEGVPPKVLTITTVKAYDRKPFIGGYAHKRTEQRYHHAMAQTDAIERVVRTTAERVSRETQTQGITRTVQTARECATQMARPGLHIHTAGDRQFVARPYFSAEQLHKLRVERSITIQSHTRGWFARRHARHLREEKEQVAKELAAEEERRRVEHERRRQKEIERRTHPRTAKDFNTLYNELEAWRLQETRKIKESSLSKEEQRRALEELLKKETKLLQTIHKLQNSASKENRQRKVNDLLEKMSGHKTWGKSGTVVETPFTVRARELMDLWHGLQITGLTLDERLDILLHIKWTVKEFECQLTREIVELVDREADILNRGRSARSLEGQRQRLSNLFLQFIETPEFNPEAIHYQPVGLEYTLRPLVRLDGKR